MKSANLIEAGGVVLAGVRLALIHIQFAARTFVTLKTLALERAFSVKTSPAVLAWVRP